MTDHTNKAPITSGDAALARYNWTANGMERAEGGEFILYHQGRAALAATEQVQAPSIKTWRERLFEARPDAREYIACVQHELGAAYKDAEIADLRALLAQRAGAADKPVATGTAKRLRDLAAGVITGEIKQFEYTLAADRIQDLEGLLEQTKAAPVAATADKPELDDLAQLVAQLVRALRKAAPGHDLSERALGYLKRKGLIGSPLRAATAVAAPAGAVAEREAALEEAIEAADSALLDIEQKIMAGDIHRPVRERREAVENAIRALKSAATEVSPAPSQKASSVPDGWISVDERLPEDTESVLIFCPDSEHGMWVAQWLAGSKTFESGVCGWAAWDEISHWKPLPATPAPADASAEGGAA